MWLEPLQKFADDKKGAIAIIFALALLPMCLVAGAAVDYSLAVRQDARLRAAADAAVLSAARDIAFTPSGHTSAGRDVAHSKARDVFKNNLSRAQALNDPQLDLSSTDVGGNIVTTAKYTAHVKPYFAKLLGMARIPLTGSAEASVARPTYKNFFFVFDISGSMAVPATAAGIATMQWETGCALACHDIVWGWESGLSFARRNNIPLRLDVLKQTSKDILKYVAGNVSSVNYSRFALYTLQHELASANGALGVLSTDYAQLASALDRIDFTATNTTDPSGIPLGWSYFHEPLAKLLTDVPASGDGSTPGTAQNYVFIMTDGVTDVRLDDHTPTFVKTNGVCVTDTGRCLSPVDPAICQTFKDRKVTVGVVYTTYLDFGGDYWNHVAPYASKIRPYLQACASPGFFYEGTNGAEISRAMMDLFLQAQGKVMLSN